MVLFERGGDCVVVVRQVVVCQVGLVDFVKGEAQNMVLEVGAYTWCIDEDGYVIFLELFFRADTRAHEEWRTAVCTGSDYDFFTRGVIDFSAGFGDGGHAGCGWLGGGRGVGEVDLIDGDRSENGDVGTAVVLGDVVGSSAADAFMNGSGDVPAAVRRFASGEHVGVVGQAGVDQALLYSL